MISNPQTKYPRRKHHRIEPRATTQPTPPPVTGPAILSVTLVGETQMLVTFTEAVVGIDETAQAIRLYLPGLYWIGSSGFGVEGNTALFNFDESMVSATEWVVPLPSVWSFESGRQLALPFGGTVG